MPKNYFNRYKNFNINGKYTPLPFIIIEPKTTDKVVTYKSDRDRLDRISQVYYDTPYYGWLILLANPRFGGVEENIPDDELIRIPFPFRDSLQQYIQQVEKYEIFYGNK